MEDNTISRKKEQFKYLIKEFHSSGLPEFIGRDMQLPRAKKVMVVGGVRRSGKTFYFYQIMKGLSKAVPRELMIYINFDDDRLAPLSLPDLGELMEAYYELYPGNKGKQVHLFLDEVQSVPGWELFARRVYEREGAAVYVTGSSALLSKGEIATQLRGRTLYRTMFPFSFREFLRLKGVEVGIDVQYSQERFAVKSLLGEYLEKGGFPEAIGAEKALWRETLETYYEMSLYKDIVEKHGVRNPALLRAIAKFLLANVSSQFSINGYYKSIKGSMPVGKETVMEYLSYLEESGMVFLSPMFDYSLKVQQANPKKAYCIDNGLRNAVSFMFSADLGRLAENMAFVELKRRGNETYYWKGRNEVDLVVKDRDGSIEAINVTYTDDIGSRELKGLLEFKKTFPKAKNLTILTRDTEKSEEGVQYVPLWKWLLS
jgi:uncharacterized protein